MLDTVTQLWYIFHIAIVAPKIYNKERNMKTIMALAFLVLSSSVFAETPILVDRHTGKYLGNLSNNQYDQNSVSNPYGRYGSEYSQDSINNPYGQYGSQYSNDSPNNPYATNPPAVVVPCYYGC